MIREFTWCKANVLDVRHNKKQQCNLLSIKDGYCINHIDDYKNVIEMDKEASKYGIFLRRSNCNFTKNNTIKHNSLYCKICWNDIVYHSYKLYDVYKCKYKNCVNLTIELNSIYCKKHN